MNSPKATGGKSGGGKRISVRIPKGSDLKQRLEDACDQVKLDEPTLVLSCVEATVEYIEKHGSITLPMKVCPHDPPPS